MSKNMNWQTNSLQQAIQRAWYRAGLIKLNERFEPWPEYLQKAVQVAALCGIAINEAEAEAAIECLFEINPHACWKLLCNDFAPEHHAALIRGILCDRYQFLIGFSSDDAAWVTKALKQAAQKRGRRLSWEEVDSVIEVYLDRKVVTSRFQEKYDAVNDW